MRQDLVPVLASGLLLFLLSSGAPAQQGAPPMATPQPSTQVQGQEAPLTNADVVKLCKLDLGDQVVIAKINQAKAVDFKLDTDSLVALKQDGVSKDVIAAMLQRATPQPTQTSPGPSNQGSATSVFGFPGAAAPATTGVRLVTKDGELGLSSLSGTTSTTYAFVTVLLFMDYPEMHAKVRTPDRRPAVLVATSQSPVSRYFVVKANSNKKDNTRSVKMGRGGAFGYKGISQPDKDWTVAYDASESAPGLWRLTLRSDLKAGEYGLWLAGSGELYDFGVD